MRILMKTFLAVSAVLSLAPTAAFAYPQQCAEICNDTVPCWEWCAVGPRIFMTCGDFNPAWCSGVVAGPADSLSSITSDEARKADEASQVCSEENQSAEQAVTTEN